MKLWKVTDIATGRYAIVSAGDDMEAKMKAWDSRHFSANARYRDMEVELHESEVSA